MTMPDLKKLRESEPFRPFTLHLTSREILAVQHPELLSISPEVNDLFSGWPRMELDRCFNRLPRERDD